MKWIIVCLLGDNRWVYYSGTAAWTEDISQSYFFKEEHAVRKAVKDLQSKYAAKMWYMKYEEEVYQKTNNPYDDYDRAMGVL